MFEKHIGRFTVGSCEGATLGTLDVAVEDGAIYLAAEEYERVGLGPSSDRDLSSRGRIGF